MRRPVPLGCGASRSTTASAQCSRGSSARTPRSAERGAARRGARALRAQVAPTTGRFLFALVAPQTDCEVLEIGGSRGYSTIWLAAGVRILGGRVLSLENDPAKVEAWRRNVAEAGLEEWAELVEGDALETLPAIDDVFDVVFLDAEKDDYETLFALARPKLEPGAVVVADNVLSHAEHARRLLARAAGRPHARERHRPARPRARAVGRAACHVVAPVRAARYNRATAERRWSGRDRFQYGQWRYQRVEAYPRDLRGIA